MTSPALLLDTGDLDGPLNMAIDEVLWQTAVHGTAFVRLYGWSNGPWLSLGYFQCGAAVREQDPWRGVPFVRRLTGGGAILHHNDLTYSIAIPIFLAPRTDELYGRLHRAIAAELCSLGVAAAVACGADGDAHGDPWCFRRADRFAVRVGGVKILGSAQRRQAGSVMIHGSILLAASPLAPDVLGIREAVGRTIARETIGAVIVRAASHGLGLTLQASELPRDLRPVVIRLAYGKYSSPEWNDRR